MGRFLLAVGLVTLTTVLAGKDKPKSEWVPLNCMGKVVVNDFGRCTQTGSHYHCPNVSMDFEGECVSVTPANGPQAGKMFITRPTAIDVEKQ